VAAWPSDRGSLTDAPNASSWTPATTSACAVCRSSAGTRTPPC